MQILHYKETEAYHEEYDQCIRSSPYGSVYSMSWYLDAVCPQWELLAMEDHSAFMPLPVFPSIRKKSIRQPDFTHQLGIFAKGIPQPDMIEKFLNAIPKEYRVRQLCLNKYNVVHSGRIRLHNTAELDLIRPYERISTGYSGRMQDNLTKAGSQSLSSIDQISVHDYLNFASRFEARKGIKLKPNEVSLLRLLSSKAQRNRIARIPAAYDGRNELCAAILFLSFNGRTSVLHAAASNAGLTGAALPFLLDAYIRKNSEKNIVFCTDNPLDHDMMECFINMGASLSEYPCLKQA